MNVLVKNLVLNGPSQLGFYEGKLEHDICFSITGVSALHWEQNPLQCEKIIDNRAQSYAVLLTSVFLIVAMWNLFSNLDKYLRLLLLLPSLFRTIPTENRRAIVLEPLGEGGGVAFDHAKAKRL